MLGMVKYRYLVSGIGFAGIIVSIVSLLDRGPGAFCEISEFVSCSSIYLSPYSKIFGVDLSIISAVFFSVLSILSFLGYRYLSLALVFVALPVVFVLIYIEFFILYALCIYCTFLQVFIFVSAAIVIVGISSGRW